MVTLAPAQQRKLEDAENIVAKYRDAYDRYGDEYSTVLGEYDAARADQENGGPPIPVSLRRRLDAERDRWDRDGHRREADSAMSVVAAYEALEPDVFWPRLSGRYRAGTLIDRSGREFQAVGTRPPYKSLFGEGGWVRFTFGQLDLDSQRDSPAVGVAGRLDGSYGLFRVSADGDYERDSLFVKMDQADLQVSCKLRRVVLDRAWMNPRVLSSRA